MEIVIGLFIISAIIFSVHRYYVKDLHLPVIDRERKQALRMIAETEGFELNDREVFLKRADVEPTGFTGFALDHFNRKLMCFRGAPGLVCDYDQILEWRILVNNRSVACLSRLCSNELKVEEPDRTLAMDDFLRKYCADDRQDPVLETVEMKFLLRNLSYPAHSFSLRDIDQPGNLEQSLRQALDLVDKFKIVMYR